jgi:dienelactone hydrolase
MKRLRRRLVTRGALPVALALLVSAAVAGCGESDESVAVTPVKTPSPEERYAAPGPYPVGNITVTLTDTARQRDLTVEIWYPAAEAARSTAAAGVPVETFFPAGPLREQYAALLAAAPTDGPTRNAHAARAAEPEASGRQWPLILFSHCHDCVRFSEFEVAERLASHGMAVAAPDHTGNTLFDGGAMLTPAFLETRALDIRFVTDALLAMGAAPGDGLNARIARRFDAARLGVFGHSFGGVTTGRVLQDDPRFRAGVTMAAPPDSPVLPGVKMKNIHQPLVFLVAREDNSITEFGNQLIRGNFTAANPPVWKIEVADAGHWSFSDICGLTAAFSAGCGEGVRQTVPGGEPFHYLPIATAVPIAQRYITAFFAAELLGDASALDVLGVATPADVVDVAAR